MPVPKLKRSGMMYSDQGDVKVTKDKTYTVKSPKKKRKRLTEVERIERKKKRKSERGSSWVNYAHPTKKDTFILTTKRKKKARKG